jgi:arylsulfatase A-like enzyme
MEHAGITAKFVTPGERDNDTVRRDLYDGEIRFTDKHVGRVLDALKATGFDDDTIIVLFSDHGEEFIDHGSRGHGHTLFRELVRIPLAIRAPGLSARRIQTTVRTVDVLPTLLDLTGLSALRDAAGQSLSALMRGEAFHSEPALAEIHPTGAPPQDCLVEDDYKLILQYPEGGVRRMLFDLRVDPQETLDVADRYPEVCDQLQQQLSQLKKKALERGRQHTPARELDLTPGQTEVLNDLGYGGGEDE